MLLATPYRSAREPVEARSRGTGRMSVVHLWTYSFGAKAGFRHQDRKSGSSAGIGPHARTMSKSGARGAQTFAVSVLAPVRAVRFLEPAPEKEILGRPDALWMMAPGLPKISKTLT